MVLREQNFDGVIDGGANVGEFAQIVRSTLPQADLICVEPNPSCAATLRKQGFRVVEAALWSEATRLTLTQPDDASTSCTVMSENGARPATTLAWTVDAVRLDSLQIFGARLLLKLDLQGAEIAALQGMGALWGRCAAVLSEVSLGAEGNYDELRRVLAEHGFREYSTLNELEANGRIVEADKLWLRADALRS